LLFDYTQRFSTATMAYGDAGKVLVVGGGTHTFPSYLIRNYPDMQVDVVEIDPRLDTLARQYFFMQDSPRLTIYHEDGRAYLNRTEQDYDLVFMDAFSTLSPPFQLTTKEAVRRIASNLQPDGVAVANIIGRYDGGNGAYLRAIRETYGTAFKNVSIHRIHPGATPGSQRQNFLLVAGNDRASYDAVSGNAGERLVFPEGPRLVLTDDYAPIERLTF
jgi:spermidine synthase